MRAGERGSGARCASAFAGFALALVAASAAAIDNPDSPDRVAAFERRAAPMEEQLAGTDGGSAAERAGTAYAQFLDAELNQAYALLLANVKGPERAALVESQRRWLRFRDGENAFIARHWTRERSGSSASLSAAQSRAALVKARVVQLLRYASEYP